MLEAKDPYIFRPLPYLIGSQEFMDDDYVGLGDLLIVPEEDSYSVHQIENPDFESVEFHENFHEKIDRDFSRLAQIPMKTTTEKKTMKIL